MKESIVDFSEEYDDYDYESPIEFEANQACDVLESHDIRNPSDFLLDANYLAAHYVSKFFSDKKTKCGKHISPDLLSCEKRISIVLNTNIIDSVKRIYLTLNNYIKITEEDLSFAKKTGDVTQEIKLVNETLKSLYEFGIPQQFAGGMIILYLEFCEGIDFGI